MMKCRICNSATKQTGYLYRCQNDLCAGGFWDKGKVKKCLRKNPDILTIILEEAEIPPPLKLQDSHFVYVLCLKGELNSVYVGMTGLHPYARYLNHIRGYRSSRHTKNRATALISFEGPMSTQNAKKREPELADELRKMDYRVYGGH